jgi:hypothetical protein
MTPFLVVGLALVVLGLALLTPGEYWRRASRRWSAVAPERIRGITRTGRSSMMTRMRATVSMVACSSYGP